ncbi:hypothetical protein [Pelomonas sp. SE-A7]|uniref:hypothetical protein n=1 Tax=Pelomonas sp. SE-A7 TaxID=3054953 RepID=UPI00259D2471|nr:hypothetical protein [Pelomonas sp. SE-A7]MDM4766163.1 hypothetical protein [Pelomonas sp. SE-A7]
MSSSNDLIQFFVVRLDADLREAWEERAAIVEFDGGLTREWAECLALLEVIRNHPARVLKSLL